MSTKPQIELFLENESGTQQVAYPFVESDHVSLSNGMDIDTMIRQDVSMPTVVHEDLSFKVGVGDQNVSSAIVDSSVAEMTIKGKTYQNILPEPSTHVLTNNKEMFKVNEGLDPNVEIVDGVSKSAILKGQTLVNIVNGISFGTGATETDNSYILTQTGTTEELRVVLESNLIELNKDYTFIYYINEKTTTKNNSLVVKNLSYLVPGNNTAITQNIGWNKIKFNVSSFGSNPRLNIAISSSEEDGVYVKFSKGSFALLSGDWTNKELPFDTIGYGMQSVKVPVLSTVGKNLLPNSDAIPFVSPATLKEMTGGNVFIEKGKTYTLNIHSITSATGLFRIGLLLFKDGINVTDVSCITFINGSLDYRGDVYKRFQTIGDTSTLNSVSFIANDNFEVYVSLVQGNNTDVNSIAKMQLEKNSVATAYEPYKSNILTVNEDVVLRGIGEVQDTLNCLTGELTQRIEEIVLDGSDDEKWITHGGGSDTHQRFVLERGNRIKPISNVNENKFLCDKFKTVKNIAGENSQEMCLMEGYDNWYASIIIDNAKLNSVTVDGFKSWLQSNNVKIQYVVENESIKTVDLSSSGNWEKIVFNGSENWNKFQIDSMLKHSQFYIRIEDKLAGSKVMCDSFTAGSRQTTDNGGEVIAGDGGNGKNVWVNILNSRLASLDVNGFKQYLQQNPMTVWYQTETHKDSTQVKQPIFFKDGHIQLSSGVENSLIPTLDYQAKTSNSYVMDLMKTNTKYTMKAKSASGTFTIDGTSYGAGTNGTFTTPSSMTNKFLVMSNKANEEVMILEGDVTDKTIPYFKGIKSAFEDEDKIEVLSQGKNLIDETLWTKSIIEDGIECLYGDGWYSSSGNVGTPILIPVDIKQGKRYRISVTHKATTHFNNYKILQDCLNNRVVGDAQSVFILDRLNTFTESNASFVANFDAKYLMVDTGNPRCYGYIKKGTLIIEEVERDGVTTAYEPYKSNSTKIPLLSPLRSLPNGVCDELIVDRMKKKATLIQRIKSTVFNGSESWNLNGFSHDKLIEFVHYSGTQIAHTIFSDRFVTGGDNVERVAFSGGSIYIRILKTKVSNVNSFKKWLSQNPLTVQYGLNTPVITEVDLEGFPYIYKDGHIFLNSEIAPVTEIKYSINQQHQIEASNQDIIRHQKEIDYLYKLIGEYVRVDYKNTLLSLNLELK